ncbi:MAG TPA: hypothetical protein RMH99_26565 [Sandaracinaceae bacterium LLY-WYZ-13_1]|nr:hypothetical protein [Sandaracinaceae bacterium LLY-WYZ-13_1]
MRHAKEAALAWSIGVGLGAAVALLLGPHAPSWGMALAFPAASLLLSAGAWLERDGGREMAHVLRSGLGFTVGFLLVTAPITWMGIARMIEIAAAAELDTVRAQARNVRGALLVRWAVASAALLPGVTALTLRRQRELADRAHAG